MDPIEAFFREMDTLSGLANLPRFTLHIVGSTALFLQSDYRRGTKDSDAVETYGFDPNVKDLLERDAGRGSKIAGRHHIYLQFIGEVLLFLPDNPVWNPWLTLQRLDVVLLDPTDVVVAKLIRLQSDDLRDIEAMAERRIASHQRVVERFKNAALRLGGSGQGHKLERAIKNLHRVERDVFVVDESEIDIPDWMLQ
jgi:hypothetical protein